MTYVYFIRIGGSVKIGCTEYPADRARNILGRKVSPADFLGCVKGGFEIENSVRRRMRSLFGPPIQGRERFKVPSDFDPLCVVSGPLIDWRKASKLTRHLCKNEERTGMPGQKWRFTFMVDWDTAKTLKLDAREYGMKLSDYLSMLVRCGYSARQMKVAEVKR